MDTPPMSLALDPRRGGTGRWRSKVVREHRPTGVEIPGSARPEREKATGLRSTTGSLFAITAAAETRREGMACDVAFGVIRPAVPLLPPEECELRASEALIGKD